MSENKARRSLSVERERRWLRALFGSALVAAAAPAALIQGCGEQSTGGLATGAGGSSSSTGGGAQRDAGERDRTAQGGGIGIDGGADIDGARDATSETDACVEGPFITQLDATVPESGPDADYYCRFDLPCGLSDVFGVVGCDLVFEAPDGAPLGSAYGCTVISDGGCPDAPSLRSGDVSLLCGCDALNGGGRRPFGGLRARGVRAPDALARYLATLAHAEAASVVAFEELGTALQRFGAPDELIAASRASAADEIRHAAVMARLALRCGGELPILKRRHARGPRGLESIARENAVEGCIRETFGALIAMWQATHGDHIALRRVFRRIASEETRHAALAWAITAWAEPRLDARARSRIASARRSALRALARDVAVEPNPLLVRAAGLPRRGEAQALLNALGAGLETLRSPLVDPNGQAPRYRIESSKRGRPGLSRASRR